MASSLRLQLTQGWTRSHLSFRLRHSVQARSSRFLVILRCCRRSICVLQYHRIIHYTSRGNKMSLIDCRHARELEFKPYSIEPATKLTKLCTSSLGPQTWGLGVTVLRVASTSHRSCISVTYQVAELWENFQLEASEVLMREQGRKKSLPSLSPVSPVLAVSPDSAVSPVSPIRKPEKIGIHSRMRQKSKYI